jgi:hypothetical protein
MTGASRRPGRSMHAAIRRGSARHHWRNHTDFRHNRRCLVLLNQK